MSELNIVALGLAAAGIWGAGDFLGGLATRRAHVFLVIVLSQGIGVLLLAGLALLTRETIPPPDQLAWAALAGISGGIGLAIFYHALSVGRMSIIASVSGVLTGTVPVIFVALTQTLPSVTQVSGFVLAALGIAFVSRSQEQVSSTRGLPLALLAGTMFGLFFIFIGHASDQAVYYPLLSARLASVGLFVVLALLAGRRDKRLPGRRDLPLIAGAGLLDVTGTVCFVLSSQGGQLDVSAVLASMYPAGTALLAWLILKERLHHMQLIGIAALLLAIPLIAQ